MASHTVTMWAIRITDIRYSEDLPMFFMNEDFSEVRLFRTQKGAETHRAFRKRKYPKMVESKTVKVRVTVEEIE